MRCGGYKGAHLIQIREAELSIITCRLADSAKCGE